MLVLMKNRGCLYTVNRFLSVPFVSFDEIFSLHLTRAGTFFGKQRTQVWSCLMRVAWVAAQPVL
jgi:hypothetical protein